MKKIIAILLVAVLLSGCHGDPEPQVFEIPEAFDAFRDYEITKGKMDDVFLAITGRELTGGGKV